MLELFDSSRGDLYVTANMNELRSRRLLVTIVSEGFHGGPNWVPMIGNTTDHGSPNSVPMTGYMTYRCSSPKGGLSAIDQCYARSQFQNLV